MTIFLIIAAMAAALLIMLRPLGLVDIEEIDSRLDALTTANEQIVAAARESERDLTDDERDELARNHTEFERLNADRNLLSPVEEERATVADAAQTRRKSDPEPPAEPLVRTGDPEIDNDRRAALSRRRIPAQARDGDDVNTGGFGRGPVGFGSFAQALSRCHRGHQMDNRLRAILAAPSTYGTEGVDADGGFAVPIQHRTEIHETLVGEETLLGRTDRLPISSSQITVPMDENAPWDASTGVIVANTGEGAQGTESKPDLNEVMIKANKITALVKVSEELLEDAPALGRYLTRKITQKLEFKISREIIAGTGGGQMLGVKDAPCTVSVAKEGGQAADTINVTNIQNMWRRMYAPSRLNAVWIANQNIESQLIGMVITGTNSDQFVYVPQSIGGNSGFANAPNDTLFGRPIIFHQAAETLGDKGDIILADLSQYLTVQRGGGVRFESSIHLHFDYGVTAFRAVMRVGGQPWWSTALSPRAGTETLSPFVVLAERA